MRKHFPVVIFLILFLAPLPLAGVDVYTPSLPIITHYFSTTIGITQLSISFYLFAYGFSQLFWGTWADHAGRKIALVTCLVVFVITSLIITFVRDIE